MKQTSVYLDEEQDRLLRHLAAEDGRALADLVREALSEYLARRRLSGAPRAVGPRRQMPDEEWRSGFTQALQRIRASVSPDLTPEEIEAEITAARAEVREERTARRRAARA